MSRQVFLVALVLTVSSCSRSVDPSQRVLGQIDSLMEARHYRRAAEVARQNLPQHPQSARLRLLLARAEFSYGNFEGTLDALQPVLQQRWGGEEIDRLTGSSYFHRGEFEKACDHLSKIVSVGSDNREVLKQYGYASYYQGDGKTALQVFTRLKESLPGDLEAHLTHDALMSLTGKWPAAQMVWTTDPMIGAQLCYPGNWTMEREEFLSSAGKGLSARFSGSAVSEEGRFLPGGVMFLTAYDNASKHPLPKFLKGSFRRGERTEEGTLYYATQPGAEPMIASLSRDPVEITRHLSKNSLRSVSEMWGFSVRDSAFSPEVSIRGQATLCFGEAVAEDDHGWEIVGRSMGVYDSSRDTFWTLVLYGPYLNREEVRALSETMFHLALFGGVTGIPPTPEQTVTAAEYEARIRGFLEAGQASRALTEAKRAVELYPESGSLHVLLAEAQEQLWHPREAAAGYEKARKLGHSTYRSELALGGLQLGLGSWDAAALAFERALGFKPSDASAWLGRGLAAYWKQDLRQALAHFQKAVEGVPALEEPRYLQEAMKGLLSEGGSEQMYWFETDEKKKLFCVPINWVHSSPEIQPGLYQVRFAPKDSQTQLLYIRYETASRRAGRIPGTAKPEEVVDAFLKQSYEQQEDPQRLWQQLSPIYERGKDYYAVGGYSFTQGSSRRQARILGYYQPSADRLHVLLFQTEADQMERLSPWLQACFNTARFNE